MRMPKAMTPFSPLPKFGLLFLPLLLAGCISFGKDPPPVLLNLTAESRVAPGTLQSGPASTALLVEEPEVPQKLATNRVPVDSGPTSVAYLKGAHWVDKPAPLMQQLLAETLSARSGRLVLTDYEAAGKAREHLVGTLVEFGLDARNMEAVATYDATLLTRGEPVGKRRFEARVPVAKAESELVGRALNEAANRIAADVVTWLGTS